LLRWGGYIERVPSLLCAPCVERQRNVCVLKGGGASLATLGWIHREGAIVTLCALRRKRERERERERNVCA